MSGIPKWLVPVATVAAILLAAAVVVGVLVVSTTRRQYVYNNFGVVESHGWKVWEVTTDGPQPQVVAELATPFSLPDGEYALQSLDLILCRDSPSSRITVSVCGDESGVPGQVLQSIQSRQSLPEYELTYGSVTTFDFGGTTNLHGGVQYWVVVTEGPNVHIGWFESAKGKVVSMPRRIDGGEWLPSPSHPELALRVRADPLPN